MKRRLQDELKQAMPFPTLEEEVYLEVQRTSQAMTRWIAEVLKPSGLSESQFNVLRILRGSRPDGLPSSRIGERMVKHDPDLTRLLDRLEAGGLVEKIRDVRDRRVVTARITEAGLGIVEGLTVAARRRLVASLRPVGPRKLGALADLLELARSGADPGAHPSSATPSIRRSIAKGASAGKRKQAARTVPGDVPPTTARRRSS